jgi:hypothetical protein
MELSDWKDHSKSLKEPLDGILFKDLSIELLLEVFLNLVDIPLKCGNVITNPTVFRIHELAALIEFCIDIVLHQVEAESKQSDRKQNPSKVSVPIHFVSFL